MATLTPRDTLIAFATIAVLALVIGLGWVLGAYSSTSGCTGNSYGVPWLC